jgi:hypothetical protein
MNNTEIIQQIKSNEASLKSATVKGLSAAEVSSLSEALQQNTNLERLSLSGNESGDEGVTAVAKALHGKNLVSLSFDNCSVNDNGAKAIAETVKASSSLQELALSHNQIGTEGAKALADAVKSSKSLTTLDLSQNVIGDEGARSLADAVRENKVFTKLELAGNNISQDSSQAVADAFQSHNAPATPVAAPAEATKPAEDAANAPEATNAAATGDQTVATTEVAGEGAPVEAPATSYFYPMVAIAAVAVIWAIMRFMKR